jgi:hypothetical protein
LSTSLNVETGEEMGPLLAEKLGPDRELRESHDQLEAYIELLGRKGSTILPLIEEKIGKL